MASIEKRRDRDGKLRYRVKIRRKGAPDISETFGRLTDARAFAQRTEADIEAGRTLTGQEAKHHTLAEATQRYTTFVLPDKAKTTWAQQRGQLRWWSDQIGHLRLIDVTPAVIAELRDNLSSRFVRSSVRGYLSAISAVLDLCVREWGWLEESPMRRVSRPSGGGARTRFLSDDERDRLLSACRESTNPYIYWLFRTSISASTCAALRSTARESYSLQMGYRHT